jgi:hypothetical protein
MALAVDAGGKVKANPKTGKIIGKASNSFAKSTANILNDIVQTASMPSKVSPGTARFNPSSIVQTSSMPVPRQVSRGINALKVTPSVSKTKRVSNDVKDRPLTMGRDGFAMLGNGVIPSEKVQKTGETPDLNPTMEAFKDMLGGFVTKPDERNDLMLPATSGGATPMISQEDIGTSGKNILERDEMWNLIGDTDSNEKYLSDAITNGMSEEDADKIRGRGDKSWWQSLSDKWSQPLSGFDYDVNSESTGDVTAIDDGTYDYDHMTADTMTVTQYMHYAELGMGGRPVEQIDPTKTYSKRRENVNYGFTPFVPDQMSYVNMVADNVMDTPYRAGTWLSGLRETITTDYTINYGNGSSISGRDFDKLSTPYLNQFYYNDRFNPERFLTKPTDNENVTALVREYAIPDLDGRETYHYGRLSAMWDNGDGTYTAEFSDGSSVDVSQEYIDSISNEDGSVTMKDSARVPVSQARGSLPANLDSLNDVDSIMASAEATGGSPLDYADVIYIPDLVLSDGTRIPYSDVERIYWDKTPENDEGQQDDDIGYEFKRFGIFDNKPRRLNQQEMFKTNERGGIDVDMSDIGNNAIDWTLGSLPISIGTTMPWVYSTSGATSSLGGVNPASYDPTTDSYGFIAGSYDDQGRLRYGVTDANGKRDDERSESTRWWNAAGNAAVPLTEMIVGPVGEQIVPLEKIFRSELPSNPTAWQVIKNALVGAAGEGVEEDLGNIFDELTEYGPSGMFTNPVTNANGEALRDMYGHEVRDYNNTSAEDYLRNIADPGDLANSFAGGVTVDALMQALPISGQLVPAVRRDMARRKTGVSQFVDPEEREDRTVSDAYSLGFDDTIGR